MSRTHATGSAITYGKRYLKNMIFNLHFTDDDGNAAAAGLDVAVYAPLLEAIEGASTMQAVTGAYIHALKAAKTEKEKAEFEAAANKRKAELR
jgi:hypothetical protein